MKPARLRRFAVATDTGRRRRRNEDAYVCVPPLFAIADGMGGAQAGEIASGLAAAVLEEGGGEGAAASGEERVRELIEEANRRVFKRSNEDAATSGMGTTMTVALVDSASGTVAFGHVGDSRAYRVRNGRLEQLTQDHSLVGELVRSGRISPEEAETHPQRAVITRALGTEADIDVDTFSDEGEPGDVYLLCSDGLTDMVGDTEILALLDEAPDIDAGAHSLVEAANSRGGEDNITVVVFELGPAHEEQTATLPAPADSAVEPEVDDEEDTLSGLEGVPAVRLEDLPEHERPPETAVAAPAVPPHSRRPPRRSILPLLLLVLAFATIALLVVWGLYR